MKDKIKIIGYVVETPDGDTIDNSFDQDSQMCIDKFMYNLNKSNREDHEDTGEVPDEIYWMNMIEDGYKIVLMTLKGELDKCL